MKQPGNEENEYELLAVEWNIPAAAYWNRLENGLTQATGKSVKKLIPDKKGLSPEPYIIKLFWLWLTVESLEYDQHLHSNFFNLHIVEILFSYLFINRYSFTSPTPSLFIAFSSSTYCFPVYLHRCLSISSSLCLGLNLSPGLTCTRGWVTISNSTRR